MIEGQEKVKEKSRNLAGNMKLHLISDSHFLQHIVHIIKCYVVFRKGEGFLRSMTVSIFFINSVIGSIFICTLLLCYPFLLF